ncbi:hypothetical protein O7635_07190 [Asanoa sp. WMMD1127]|uniref:hypothetical protein n=1 Tax=Asanoa sp. WMMD1127 TaxID=3016107 RepID=UPI002416F512|nr:hypothetical protein [Asanoa sp. WMMD1127]MDG4821637.1 hypothetical protein [Asanoa sp. WMMD1127]
MSVLPHRTAWVPIDDHTPLDDAAELAAAWVREQARAHALQPFAPANGSAGPRHAVLAYLPDYDDVSRSIQAARHGAFAAVESGATPLIGWAMETKAVDLTTGEVTADTRSPALKEAIERIHFFDSNGWSRGFGADGAKRILGDLRPADRDKKVILGSLCALGSRGKALERLSELADRVWKRRSISIGADSG